MVKSISTLHDPHGAFVPLVDQVVDILFDTYHSLSVVSTPNTSTKTTNILKKHHIEVSPIGTDSIGKSRREALRLGSTNNNLQYFHYCDFDRLLHWAKNYPTELNIVVKKEIPKSDFLVIGRSPSAFKSHPLIQIESETITNKIFSLFIGEFMDITAGSCGMSRSALELILAFSTEDSNATDAEWPMIISIYKNPKLLLDYIEVNGLEFENPTFFGKNSKKLSENKANYLNRVILTRKSIESILRLSMIKTEI